MTIDCWINLLETDQKLKLEETLQTKHSKARGKAQNVATFRTFHAWSEEIVKFANATSDGQAVAPAFEVATIKPSAPTPGPRDRSAFASHGGSHLLACL